MCPDTIVCCWFTVLQRLVFKQAYISSCDMLQRHLSSHPGVNCVVQPPRLSSCPLVRQRPLIAPGMCRQSCTSSNEA